MSKESKELSGRQLKFLTGLFPEDGCLTDPEAMAVFATDTSRKRGTPLAVVRPENSEQCCELLKWAQAEAMPVFTRARGTNTVGNTVPVIPGIVVSTLRMNRIISVDPDDFVAEVEPGVITSHLQEAAVGQNMLYPPDPASMKFSTIGGNVATCAGGMRALKYGVTRDYVLGLEAAIPGGHHIKSGGRVHKNVVGLDLTRLFVGSAGKLGIITKLFMKLIPLPEATASVLVGFSNLREAIETIGAVFRAGILPTACEFIDSACIGALRNCMDDVFPEGVEAALLIKVDGSEAGVAIELARLGNALKSPGLISMDIGRGEDEERLWEVRRTINPAAFQVRPDKMGDDIAVPRGKLLKAVEGCQKIGEEFNLPVLCFGHLGDGNIHVNVMYNASWPEELEAAKKAKDAIFKLALSLGGTISGEHGTGLSKKDYVDLQLGPVEQALMSGVKSIFDPKEIMNPGKGW